MQIGPAWHRAEVAPSPVHRIDPDQVFKAPGERLTPSTALAMDPRWLTNAGIGRSLVDLRL